MRSHQSSNPMCGYVWLCAILAFGCAQPATFGATDSGGRSSSSSRSGTGAVGVDEECGNQIDEDQDGSFDEGCACDPGSVRECYVGPSGTLGKGLCAPGTQECGEDGEFSGWGRCRDAILPVSEVLNNQDDDCDGETDEAPLGDGTANTCAGGTGGVDPSCATEMTSLCPAGLTPTYTRRHFDTTPGGSGIEPGDDGDVLTMTCAMSDCPAGQVAVESAPNNNLADAFGEGGFSRDGDPASFEDLINGRGGMMGEMICTSPPPDCPAGTSPNFPRTGEWRCDKPCELIVRAGGLFGFERACAPIPDMSCPGGQVPTFVYDTEQWECRNTCNNGEYDQIHLNADGDVPDGGSFFGGGGGGGGGMLVCVPC